MNNDAVQELIKGIGIMTELWIISYRSFVAHGMDAGEAMVHTREFIGAIAGSVLKNGKQEETK